MLRIDMRFPEGRAKCLTLSYDDGVQQDIRLCQLMERCGVAGTFNINTGCCVPEGTVFQPGQIHRRLTSRQSLALYGKSPLFEVATHGYTHPHLHRLPVSQATFEILTDRRNIEAQFGTICRGHAYPYGAYNSQVMDALCCCGIVYARTTLSTYKFSLPDNFLQWHPTCHHNDPRLMELANNFLQEPVSRDPRLFYLWGHSYEFEEKDNWHVIEGFFQKLSGREDVWYATNIQIYDYVQAYQQLIYSADGQSIYNPTSSDLWLWIDRKMNLKVPAGQRVTL